MSTNTYSIMSKTYCSNFHQPTSVVLPTQSSLTPYKKINTTGTGSQTLATTYPSSSGGNTGASVKTSYQYVQSMCANCYQ